MLQFYCKFSHSIWDVKCINITLEVEIKVFKMIKYINITLEVEIKSI